MKDEASEARRAAIRRVGAGHEERTVAISRVYDAGIEDVWDACTNAERIPRWFLPVTGDLRAGGRYQLEGNAGGVIERCDPPHGFAATWEFGDTVSRIELQLTAEPGGRTQLELRHTVPVDDHWNQFGPGAVGVGWDLAVLGLGLHLASGEPVDREEVTAWLGSEDGRAFMASSSDSWAAARVAAGDDPATARAAADRTTAAYTGG